MTLYVTIVATIGDVASFRLLLALLLAPQRAQRRFPIRLLKPIVFSMYINTELRLRSMLTGLSVMPLI